MGSRSKWKIALATFAVSTVLGLPPASEASSFRGLIGSPGVSPQRVEALGISDDGRVVVGALYLPGVSRPEAFRWTAESGFERLGFLGGEDQESRAVAVSADGSVVVGASSSPESGIWSEPFRWESSTGMVGLGDLPGGGFEGSATDVSADGAVVAGRSSSTLASNSLGEGFRWTAATGMVGLGIASQNSFNYSFANGVSGDGSTIVGSASTAQGHKMYRWTEIDGMVLLGTLGNDPLLLNWGLDISADGARLFGWTEPPSQLSRGLLWTAVSGLVDLGTLSGASASRLWKVSADGSVAGGDSFRASDRVATIWDEAHGMRELRQVLVEAGLAQEIEGWTLEYVAGIAADNLTIVGSGINPSGQFDAFEAHLGPPTVVQIPTLSLGALLGLAVMLGVAGLRTLRQR